MHGQTIMRLPCWLTTSGHVGRVLPQRLVLLILGTLTPHAARLRGHVGTAVLPHLTQTDERCFQVGSCLELGSSRTFKSVIPTWCI